MTITYTYKDDSMSSRMGGWGLAKTKRKIRTKLPSLRQSFDGYVYTYFSFFAKQEKNPKIAPPYSVCIMSVCTMLQSSTITAPAYCCSVVLII